MNNQKKIGLGGGCHWCTEAVFQSLIGVSAVKQGWIASKGANAMFSEAVMLDYDPTIIPLKVLVEIHLHTHKSTSSHSMRKKYRSAVYFFNKNDEETVKKILYDLQFNFDNKLVTQILQFSEFQPSRKQIVDYYYKNPTKPFCETFINPKLQFLIEEYHDFIDKKKLIMI